MNITSKEALQMILAFKGSNDDRWIKHSICVGNTAGVIAKSLKLDVDYAKTLGYVHDIGKAVGPFSEHNINGYNYLKQLGYDEKYYNICLVHSYLNHDYKCISGPKPLENSFMEDFIKNYNCSIYEQIINLCDIMCTTTVVTIDKRLIDIMTRWGVNENTQYHIVESFKLKAFIDSQLGFNVYDLFPSIKENL